MIEFHEVREEIPGPIYIYYQLDNFYQNHRRYVKSRDNQQLAGTWKDTKDLTDCDPIIKVEDLWDYQRKNMKGLVMPLEDPAIPCGLVAKSLFNDTFKLYKKTGASMNPSSDTPISISSDNIAWSSDITYKFKNIQPDTLKGDNKGKTWEDVQWKNMTDGK